MKFFVIGDANLDNIYHLDHFPAAGEEVLPIRSGMQPGGAGGTMAVTLARLGHEVTLAACVGDDVFGEAALAEVRAAGVSESALQTTSKAPTSVITVMLARGKGRGMLGSGGANRELNPSKLKKKDLDGIDALLVSAYSLIEGPQREYALKAIEHAKKASVPLFLDLGTGAVAKAGEVLLEKVTEADYLTLNQKELVALTGADSISAALGDLQARGVRRVAVKVGDMGSIVWEGEENALIDAILPEGEEVLDTTGAGDTYTAVFAHAVLTGYPMQTAGSMANAAGGLASTQLGAQRRVISLKDITPAPVQKKKK